VIQGMNRFCGRCGPEKPGYLGITLFLGLFGKGQIPAVGLGFSGKGLLEILSALFHNLTSVFF
jgi:hypothetical protein